MGMPLQMASVHIERTPRACTAPVVGTSVCVCVRANIVEVVALAVFDFEILHVRGGMKRERLSAHRSATLT